MTTRAAQYAARLEEALAILLDQRCTERDRQTVADFLALSAREYPDVVAVAAACRRT